MGWVLEKWDNDLAQAVTFVRRALDLAPHDLDILASAARILTSLGRLDEALVIRQYVVARDPLNPIRYNNIGALNIYRHDYAEASRNLSKILEISPDYAGANFFVGLTALMMGDAAAALDSFDREPDDIWRVKGRALANHALGNTGAANDALAELIAETGDEWPVEVAHVYAYRNDRDQAFEWLDRDLGNPGGWAEARLMPLFDNLRDDPRWQVFLEKVDASDAQLAAIEFDVTLPAPNPE